MGVQQNFTSGVCQESVSMHCGACGATTHCFLVEGQRKRSEQASQATSDKKEEEASEQAQEATQPS